MKKKICICLTSDYYLKYINYNAFEELEKKFKVTYLINKRKFKNINRLTKKKTIFYYTSRINDLRIQRLYLIIRSKFKNKSKTFDFVNEYFQPGLKNFFSKERIDYRKLSFFTKIKKILYYYLFIYYKKIFIKILSSNIFFRFSYRYFTYFLKKNNELKDRLEKINPDLIIYPTHLYESEVFSLMNSASNLKKKILYLIDNWDNLSTKTIMLERPDYVTVWGEQTLNHAKKIHNFDKKKVFLLGNPKFDYYRVISKKKYKPIFDYPYILFLGVREDTDELGPLEILNLEIEKNKKIYKDLKIIYRPHPYNSQKNYVKFKKLKLKNINFDLSSDLKFYKTKTRDSGNISSEYYISLLKNSLFITGGITTVLIESLLLDKKYIVISHDDKNNYLSTRNLYKSFAHFKNVEHLKNVYISKSKIDYPVIFRNLFLKKNRVKKIYGVKLNHFFFSNKNRYSKNLLNICKDIIN